MEIDFSIPHLLLPRMTQDDPTKIATDLRVGSFHWSWPRFGFMEGEYIWVDVEGRDRGQVPLHTIARRWVVGLPCHTGALAQATGAQIRILNEALWREHEILGFDMKPASADDDIGCILDSPLSVDERGYVRPESGEWDGMPDALNMLHSR